MNSKNEIIKNFTIGFIPIFIFLIADLFYGVEAGIIIALVFGIGELIFFYIKDHKIEKFIIFDISLLVLLGLISILLENEFLFLIKPAIIELIIALFVGIHGFTNKPVLLYIGKRYLKNLQIGHEQEMLLKTMTRFLFVILILHSALIIYSAYFLSHEWWAFISGGLFYIIMGIVFAGQWLIFRFKNKKNTRRHEEWFDIVDQNGKILKQMPRSQVHGNPDLLHPTVHLHVFDRNGRLFLQKRSQNKDLYPGKWDTAVGGHVSSGESIQNALLRESKEELGIDGSNAQPLFRYEMRNKYESELVHTFKIKYNGPFKLNTEEIETGRFWSFFEIDKNIGTGIFTPNFVQEFQMLKKLKVI